VGVLEPTPGHDPPERIPAVAELAGVRVGFDTMGWIEKKLGAGEPMIGGHPQGARVWRCKSPRASIYADGFDYVDRSGREGAVIDTLVIEAQSRASLRGIGPPFARVASRVLRLSSGIGLGMSRRQALALRRIRIPYTWQDRNTLTWKEPGFSRVREGTEYTEWQVELRFRDDRLDWIRVSCG
jgi:hypothetical protein